MKPYYEEKNDKVVFKLNIRNTLSPLTETILKVIDKTKNNNEKYLSNYKEKLIKSSVKFK